MRRVFLSHPETDAVLFLGDGAEDAGSLAEESRCPFYIIAGNCDRSRLSDPSAPPTEMTLTLEGKRMFLCHGHLFAVKYTTDTLSALARERGYDMLLFGHTHLPYERYIGGDFPHYLFNPGSIGAPPNGTPSYGILRLHDGNVLFSHGEIKGI